MLFEGSRATRRSFPLSLRSRSPWSVVSLIVVAGALVAGGCTGGSSKSSAAGPALPPEAQTIVDSPTYRHGAWSWDAVELGSGKSLYANSQDKLNFLGSTTKLFTVGAYYDDFGQDSTLETPVYATGTRAGDSLQGDLVLVGSGDFILGGRGVLNGELEYGTDPADHVYYYATSAVVPVKADPLAGLDKIAGEVKAKGVTTLQGDVLVNDKLWKPYETKEGVLTSIMVNDNLLDILVNPGAKAGDPVSMNTIPQTGFFDVVNQAVTSAADSQSTVSSTLDRPPTASS